jgi:hypothetical protein
MQADVTIPEKTKTQRVIQIVVAPPSKIVEVLVESPDGVQTFQVDISDLWSGATTTQQNTIKVFFKRVGALALDMKNEADGVDVTESDVSGDIFED